MASPPIPLHIFPSLDSTNDEGKRRLQSGQCTSPCIILAHTQTLGRGTQGRTWQSPAGSGLYFSLVIPNTETAPLILSTEITRNVAEVCVMYFQQWQIPLTIKPINDLMLPLPDGSGQTGKAGGILVESLMQGSDFSGYVIGIGLNWTQAPAIPDARNTAVAFAHHWKSMSQHSAEAILTGLCEALLAMTRLH